MLVIRRYLKTRQRRRHHHHQQQQQQQHGAGLANVLGNTIKNLTNKITSQKVLDTVIDGTSQIAAKSAVQGVQKLIAKNKKKLNNKKAARVDTIHALINGSGIIYE